jgi:hypothetical protein
METVVGSHRMSMYYGSRPNFGTSYGSRSNFGNYGVVLRSTTYTTAATQCQPWRQRAASLALTFYCETILETELN